VDPPPAATVIRYLEPADDRRKGCWLQVADDSGSWWRVHRLDNPSDNRKLDRSKANDPLGQPPEGCIDKSIDAASAVVVVVALQRVDDRRGFSVRGQVNATTGDHENVSVRVH
jgi:hypothetical protein